MERIDLHIEAESVPLHDLVEMEPGETSDAIRARVIQARKNQSQRFIGQPEIHCNAQMPDQDIEKYCIPESHAKIFLLNSIHSLQLSARSYTRILKVSRTIADLAGSEIIELNHVAEALHFRSLDKPLIIPYTKRNLFRQQFIHLQFKIFYVMQTASFEYKNSISIGYRGCIFHSLIELKYVLSIEDSYWFLREHTPIWYDPKTFLPTSCIRETTKKYTPDFLIRNKLDSNAWLIELKPKEFNDEMQINNRTRIAENYIRKQNLDWEFKIVYDNQIRLTHEKHKKFMDLRNDISSFNFQRHIESIDKKFNNNQRNYFKTIPTGYDEDKSPSDYENLVKYGAGLPKKVL